MQSNVTVEMATEGAETKAEYMSTLPVYALNTSDQVAYRERPPLDVEIITVPDVRGELLSVDGFYRDQHYDISLHQPPGECGMHAKG